MAKPKLSAGDIISQTCNEADQNIDQIVKTALAIMKRNKVPMDHFPIIMDYVFTYVEQSITLKYRAAKEISRGAGRPSDQNIIIEEDM